MAAQVELLESRELLTLTYHGGALLQNVAAQNIYLGSDWATSLPLKQQAAKLDAFTSTLVQSKYMDSLTLAGYNVYRGTASASVVNPLSLPKSTTIQLTDAQIQSTIQAMVTAKKVQAPDVNRLYIVYVEPGVLVGTGGSGLTFNSGAYHSAFAGTKPGGGAINIHYIVVPYPGFPNSPTNSTQPLGFSFNTLTAQASRELINSVTNPDSVFAGFDTSSSFLGWYDEDAFFNGEAGDLNGPQSSLFFGFSFGFTQSTVVMFQGYAVTVGSDQTGAALSANGVAQTLTAPKSVTLTTVSPTKGQLSWSPVALAQGYRIYSVVGTQRTLLTTLGAGATTFQLTGLSAGVTKSLFVEAFNGPSFADSAVVTRKFPF